MEGLAALAEVELEQAALRLLLRQGLDQLSDALVAGEGGILLIELIRSGR